MRLLKNIFSSVIFLTSVFVFRTTGEQADVEQGMVAELRRVVTEHGIRASNSHTFLLEPGDQPEQLTVTLKGVPAEVAGGQGGSNWISNVETRQHTGWGWAESH